MIFWQKKIVQFSVVTFWRLVFSHKSNLMNSTDKGFPGQLERWKCWQPGERIKCAECAVFAASQVSHQPIKKGWGQPFLNTPRGKKNPSITKTSNWRVLASILRDAKNDTFPLTLGRCWCFKDVKRHSQYRGLRFWRVMWSVKIRLGASSLSPRP